ncbi:6,7-dimethyl-8-ribityllumazine synthase [Kluyvera cryocrescens]|uniref:6,7-dimethyl-8-ribityllumazine synthase n=1 Tax=Kluyvera cryocrescens TaxID=580 RepID=A0A485CY50_KLUCR|nr:6,7-dimethyl-8-ribityllumazine synthase [Kluyvera cryocrescens]
MNIIEANVATPDARVAITIARFNNFINDSLLEGAIDALKRIGQVKDENITVVWVPGAYELPLAAGALAKTGKYDAVIALGTVYPWPVLLTSNMLLVGQAMPGARRSGQRNPGSLRCSDHRKY